MCRTQSAHGEGGSFAEGLPRLPFYHPVLPAEGNKCNKYAVLGEICAEHHGKAMATSTMADQPSVERWCQSNAGQRVGKDVGDKIVDFLKPSFGGLEVSSGDFNDVINHFGEVLVNQWMPNDAHQAAVVPPALASWAR